MAETLSSGALDTGNIIATKGEKVMSTLAYGSLVRLRRTGALRDTPDATSYLDTLASLVPAEVLALHAFIVSVAATTTGDSTSILEASKPMLKCLFGVLIFLSVALYVLSRVGPDFNWKAAKFEPLDILRGLIPPIAFVAWTMLGKVTLFDAVWSNLNPILREVIPAPIAVFFGVLASKLKTSSSVRAPETPRRRRP